MNDPAERILITGASGYIGRRMVAVASAAGLEVVASVRRPDDYRPPQGVRAARFDLADSTDPDEALDGVGTVIHLAAILAGNSLPPGSDEDLNVSGTRRLLEAARRKGVRRFVFLSTQSAAADSPTRYGRSKWRIEQLLTREGEVAVRTGLVSGGAPRGLYGVLFKLSRRFPVLPIVRPAAPVYPVHVDDLCGGLLALARSTTSPERLVRIAAPTVTSIGNYVRLLARHRHGLRVRLVPIPAGPILGLSRLTEALPFLPTVSRERVLGLIALRPMDPSPDLPDADVGPPLRDVAEIFAEEGQRRRLLSEGLVLGTYVLGQRPPCGVLRRYVRAVVDSSDREPLPMTRPLLAWPRLLRCLEPIGARGDGRFRKRLDLATRISEMTPEGARRFHNYEGKPFLVGAAVIAWLVAVEALLLPVRLLAGLRRTRR